MLAPNSRSKDLQNSSSSVTTKLLPPSAALLAALIRVRDVIDRDLLDDPEAVRLMGNIVRNAIKGAA